MSHARREVPLCLMITLLLVTLLSCLYNVRMKASLLESATLQGTTNTTHDTYFTKYDTLLKGKVWQSLAQVKIVEFSNLLQASAL